MDNDWMMVALFALGGLQGMLGGWLAWGKALKRHQRDIASAGRYELACREVLTWCCDAEFRAARRDAAHIMAIGEGGGLNSGTPCGDEPCTVNGLREQLRRINREPPNVRAKPGAVGDSA